MKRSPRTRKISVNLSESISRQLNMYALAAGAAGVGVLALAQPSQAKIVYTPTHKRILINQPLYVDLNHDGIRDFSFEAYVIGSSSHRPSSADLTVVGWNQGDEVVGYRGSFRAYASALRAGARIGPRKAFISDMPATMADARYSRYFGPWANGGKGVRNRYVGFKFVIKGKDHFGWARWNVRAYYDSHGHPTVSALLTGYAYETIPNKPIIAGKTQGSDAVVEPATLGHLAAGAPGLHRVAFGTR
jgi:hypothetical protein